jgi:hypothetical protein
VVARVRERPGKLAWQHAAALPDVGEPVFAAPHRRDLELHAAACAAMR